MCSATRKEAAMNETVRVTSTARKISRSWLWRLFSIFFWLNIMLLAVSLLGFCFTQEHAALGHDWIPGLERGISGNFSTGVHLLHTLQKFFESLRLSEYHFALPGGQTHSVSLTGFYDYAKSVGLFLLVFEACILLGQMIWGPRRARKLLRPLDKLARAARELSREPRPAAPEKDDAKLHDLENAIGRISPSQPGQKLRMGDQDLQGLEAAINDLLDRMHRSYQQQARFVSDASHELRTPISVIQGYAAMLDRWGKQDEKVLDESIAAIKSEAGYMNHLVEQLLFLARGDTGRNQLNFETVQLDELMKEIYEDSLLIDKAHDWRIDVQSGVCCTGDRDALKQCARVLTDNAMKYTPEKGIIRLRAYNSPEGEPRIEVQDSGIGVSAEDAAHVFERFYRSDPARNRLSGGTGLGLSIAHWIAERHGGHIDLISRTGIGTRMTLCLPKSKES